MLWQRQRQRWPLIKIGLEWNSLREFGYTAHSRATLHGKRNHAGSPCRSNAIFLACSLRPIMEAQAWSLRNWRTVWFLVWGLAPWQRVATEFCMPRCSVSCQCPTRVDPLLWHDNVYERLSFPVSRPRCLADGFGSQFQIR